MEAGRDMGTSLRTRPLCAPRGGGAAAQGALRRRPIDTHVSQEQRDAAGNGDCAASYGTNSATPGSRVGTSPTTPTP